MENAANPNLPPKTGAIAMGSPLKTAAGTEAPVRLIGMIHHNQ